MAKDQRGASILFALFLMLVCLAVGAVVLTAGTSASGRKSRIVGMDQRYYSVESAGEIIRGLIEEQSVTVVREKITNKETVYRLVIDEDGQKHRVGSGTVVSDETTYNVHLEGSTDTLSADAEDSVLITAVTDLIEGYENAQSVYLLELPNASSAVSHTYTLSHKNVPSGVDASALSVQIVMTTDTAGDMTVTYTSKDASSGDSYSLTQTYRLTLSTRESSEKESGTPVITPDGSDPDYFNESHETVLTESKKDTFVWVYEGTDILS